MPETNREDDTQRNGEDIKNLINYPELIHKFPSNGKYLYGRSHILLACLLALCFSHFTPIIHLMLVRVGGKSEERGMEN